MITLIQQGSVCDLESSEPGCQEDAFYYKLYPLNEWMQYYYLGFRIIRFLEKVLSAKK